MAAKRNITDGKTAEGMVQLTADETYSNSNFSRQAKYRTQSEKISLFVVDCL